MAMAFRVSSPFSRKDPVTGEMASYDLGDLVVRSDLVEDIRASEHGSHGHMTVLPDSHEAVLPHLPEDHPARVEHSEMVQAGLEPESEEVQTRRRRGLSEAATAEEPAS